MLSKVARHYRSRDQRSGGYGPVGMRPWQVIDQVASVAGRGAADAGCHGCARVLRNINRRAGARRATIP